MNLPPNKTQESERLARRLRDEVRYLRLGTPPSSATQTLLLEAAASLDFTEAELERLREALEGCTLESDERGKKWMAAKAELERLRVAAEDVVDEFVGGSRDLLWDSDGIPHFEADAAVGAVHRLRAALASPDTAKDD